MTDAKSTDNTGDAETATQPADPARESWFARFGYTGADNEVVTLRNNGGTALAQHVWEVYKGLRVLEDDYTGQFHRTANSAYGDRRPVDVAKRLTLDEHGTLTDYASGLWRPGRREIVLALLDLDEEAVATFAEAPLVRKEAAETA